MIQNACLWLMWFLVAGMVVTNGWIVLMMGGG